MKHFLDVYKTDADELKQIIAEAGRTARVLSRYVDMIMIRTFEEQTLLEMAEHATIPVINGLTNRTHPCQIMADVMTFEEHRGSIAGKKVVWTGDGNNVCASFLHAAGQFGFDFTFTGPETLDPEAEIMGWARNAGAKVTVRFKLDLAAVRHQAIAQQAAHFVHLSRNQPHCLHDRLTL